MWRLSMSDMLDTTATHYACMHASEVDQFVDNVGHGFELGDVSWPLSDGRAYLGRKFQAE
jgi:hypothetical protein